MMKHLVFKKLSPSVLRGGNLSLISVGVGLIVLFELSSCTTSSVSPAYNNTAPVIESIEVLPRDTIALGDTLQLVCHPYDLEGDTMTIVWRSEFGRFLSDTGAFRTTRPDTGALVKWIPPNRTQFYGITCYVKDEWHTTDSTVTVLVTTRAGLNHPPTILGITVFPDSVRTGGTVLVTAQATDPEHDSLRYIWTAPTGVFIPSTGPSVRWVAPEQQGVFQLRLDVTDSYHYTTDSIAVTVVADTITQYQANFETDEVTGRWSSIGLLAGLGTAEGLQAVVWDSLDQAMAVTSLSDYGTYAFVLGEMRFGVGTFRVSVTVQNDQYGLIAFLPKIIDKRNYLEIGVNPFQQVWEVYRCIDGSRQFLGQGIWSAAQVHGPISFVYHEADGIGSASVNGQLLWIGAVTNPFIGVAQMGVGLYGVNQAPPALFDNFRVTIP